LLENLAQATCAATADQPYHDLEQGWELAIWSDASWTYGMAGDGEPYGQYHTRFRVAVAEFRAAWERAIAETSRTSFRSLAAAIAHRGSAKALILFNQGLTRATAWDVDPEAGRGRGSVE
jgi:broad specificity phosphatase PhoE